MEKYKIQTSFADYKQRGMSMKIVIDRFEGNFAVCEKDDRTMINIEKNKIPSDAAEGDVLNIEGDTITVDVEETKRRKKEIEEMTRDLWK